MDEVELLVLGGRARNPADPITSTAATTTTAAATLEIALPFIKKTVELRSKEGSGMTAYISACGGFRRPGTRGQ